MAPDNAAATPTRQYTTDASPPLPLVALVSLMVSVAISTLPTWESVDTVATVDTFANRSLDGLVSLRALAWFRTLVACGMISLQVYQVMLGPGWDQETNYLPQSKLRNTVIPMRGIRTQYSFTCWTWNLLAMSFALNATITHLAIEELTGGRNLITRSWILRLGIVLFEIAAPMTLLVSLVVRYRIWPNILENGGETDVLRRPRAIILHNANVVLALSEVALLGKLPVRFSDFAMAPLFGLAYILFTWGMMYTWKPGEGPHFIYHFFDTTLGEKMTCIVLLVLLAVLSFFYAVFALAEGVFEFLGNHVGSGIGGLIIHTLVIGLVCSGVCRFRD